MTAPTTAIDANATGHWCLYDLRIGAGKVCRSEQGAHTFEKNVLVTLDSLHMPPMHTTCARPLLFCAHPNPRRRYICLLHTACKRSRVHLLQEADVVIQQFLEDLCAQGNAPMGNNRDHLAQWNAHAWEAAEAVTIDQGARIYKLELK